jgi:hypothetical protein
MTMDGTKTGVCICGERGEVVILNGVAYCPAHAAEASRYDEAEHPDPEAATYRIEVITDFLKVPEDRLAACLNDFYDFLTMARRIIERAEIAGRTIGVDLTAQIDPFEWTDDGRRKRKIEIRGGDQKGGAA